MSNESLGGDYQRNGLEFSYDEVMEIANDVGLKHVQAFDSHDPTIYQLMDELKKKGKKFKIVLGVKGQQYLLTNGDEVPKVFP